MMSTQLQHSWGGIEPTITELRTPEDRLRCLDQNSLDLQAFALSLGGLSWEDAEGTFSVVRQNLYQSSKADNLEDLIEEAQAGIRKQHGVNMKFVALYSSVKNTRLMERGVKQGLGNLANSPEFDIESIAAEGWIYVLTRLSTDTYEFRSPAEEGGFVKACGRQQGLKAKDRYTTRLKRAQLSHHEFECNGVEFANSAEDRWDVQPDPDKPNPHDAE